MSIECSQYSDVFYQMNVLSKEMNLAFESETGISFTKLEILYQIYQVPNMCQQDIQQKLTVDSASITRHLKKLEAEKLISRKKDEANRRFVRINLTDSGREQLKQLIAAKNRYEERFFSNLSTAEISSLVKMMQTMTKNISSTKTN